MDGAFPTISCNKDLPEGLVLGADGTISGTPTVPSPASDYQITGTNNVETKSVTISITIEDNGCEALDEFPAAMNGATSQASVCPEGYSGMATRECVNGVFQPINYDGCTLLAPSSFSYSPASMSRDSLEAIYIQPSIDMVWSYDESSNTFTAQNGNFEYIVTMNITSGVENLDIYINSAGYPVMSFDIVGQMVLSIDIDRQRVGA